LACWPYASLPREGRFGWLSRLRGPPRVRSPAARHPARLGHPTRSCIPRFWTSSPRARASC
jgi:hypothetical protein